MWNKQLVRLRWSKFHLAGFLCNELNFPPAEGSRSCFGVQLVSLGFNYITHRPCWWKANKMRKASAKAGTGKRFQLRMPRARTAKAAWMFNAAPARGAEPLFTCGPRDPPTSCQQSHTIFEILWKSHDAMRFDLLSVWFRSFMDLQNPYIQEGCSECCSVFIAADEK